MGFSMSIWISVGQAIDRTDIIIWGWDEDRYMD